MDAAGTSARSASPSEQRGSQNGTAMKTLHLISIMVLLTFSIGLVAEDEIPPQLKAWLATQDPDGDGRIARDEATGLMKRFFNRNDADKDGFLDRKELRELAERLAKNNGGNRNGNQNRNQRTFASDAQIGSKIPESVEVELNIAYRKGNKAWQLDLARPKQASSSPRPVIVFVHGGGWVGGDKRTESFIGPALKYASNGYVTISVNYRLDREILPCVQDVKCAVRWLRAHAQKYNIDPNRIGAYGNSAGAHLVTMLGLSHTEPALEGDGPWQDFSSRVQAVTASATPTLPRFGRGSDELKKLVAPMTYVSPDCPPMLLFHDEGDRTVPVINSDNFVRALKESGAEDITYKRYANKSGHGVFRRNEKETVPMMEAFFARTLQPLDQADKKQD
jgi:acetyl esterase/lipase